MNNQFSGPNAWGDYLAALEEARPVIEAIAVTDYYVTETYQEVLRHRDAGRLPNAALIFPNVEVRLDVATSKGGFVNLHLFVSPEDPQHVEELQSGIPLDRLLTETDGPFVTRGDRPIEPGDVSRAVEMIAKLVGIPAEDVRCNRPARAAGSGFS